MTSSFPAFDMKIEDLYNTVETNKSRKTVLTEIGSIIKNSHCLSLNNESESLRTRFLQQQKSMQKFNIKQKKIKNEIDKIKMTNSNFITSYQKMLKQKRTDEIINSSTKSPFKDILKEYEKRNYKLPYLTEKASLFQLSPLLVENEQIETYFRNFDDYEKNPHLTKNSSLVYINKLKGQLRKQMFGDASMSRSRVEKVNSATTLDTEKNEKEIHSYQSKFDPLIRRVNSVANQFGVKNTFSKSRNNLEKDGIYSSGKNLNSFNKNSSNTEKKKKKKISFKFTE